jgi:hypothetical protein
MLLGAAKNKFCSQQIWSGAKAIARITSFSMCNSNLHPFRWRNAVDHLIYTELSCNNPSVLTIVPA